MKISIITVVYNNKSTIKQAIDSVLNQSFKNIEYIIVDGKSTDGTVEIIKSYEDKISKFISESDKGIYDAMNKGIALATGDVIGILNSDDFYKTNDIIEVVANEFLHKDIDCLYGDLEYVSQKDVFNVVRYWKSKPYKEGLFQRGWHPAHPTFFVKKECYDKYGTFNLNFQISADYEIMLRFLERYKLKSIYVHKTFVKMRIGGESNKNMLNILKANIQSYKSWKLNGLHVNPFVFILKPLSKILQLFVR